MRTTELKRWRMGVKIDSNGDSVHCMRFWWMFDHVVFSGVVNVTVTTKIKACGWRNVLVVQIESIKSPRARSASGITVSTLVCYCGCCDLLLSLTTARQFTTQWWRQFFAGVRCHCSPAKSATLRSLSTVHSWLSTVHSQQQECTPDRQECTVNSEASEAWQTCE